MWEKLSVKILRGIASKYKTLHSLGNISKQSKSVLLETLKKVMEFKGNTLFTKAEHGNKRVLEIAEEDTDDETEAKKEEPKKAKKSAKKTEPIKQKTEKNPKVIGLFQDANYDIWVITNNSQVIRLFEKDKSYVVLKKEKSIKEAFDWLLKHTKKDIMTNNYTYNFLTKDGFKSVGGYGNFLKKYNLELTETSTENKMIFYVDFVDAKFKKDLASVQKYF